MYRFVFPVLLAAALTADRAAADSGQLDANISLFTVMAAINAAGYDTDLQSPNNHPIRMAIRQELAKREIPSLARLKEFVARHHYRSDTAELSQYLSFALCAGPPPAFALKQKDIELPPDATALKDFSPLLAAFYKEANIEDLWKRSQPAIDQYIARYHAPVSDAVLKVNLYLRQQTSGFRNRRFQVFIELQGPPNVVQTRSYGNDYFVVITPSPEPRSFDVRHAYLAYSLDPLATRYQEILNRKRGLIDHAERAQALPDSFKQDFLLLTTQSLVKAIEARLDQQPEMVLHWLNQGYILTPYFAERLAAYEKQEQAMLLYYQTMVSGIDLKKEDERLSNVNFDREAAPARAVPVPPPPPVPLPTGAAKTIEEADRLYAARIQDPDNLERAKKAYLSVLEQTDEKSMHAAAYYGLARIAVLQKDPETAERMFQKTLELEPEPAMKAWALVYLGRLSLAARDGVQAGKYFQSALQVPGASQMAREAAQQGMQQSSHQ